MNESRMSKPKTQHTAAVIRKERILERDGTRPWPCNADGLERPTLRQRQVEDLAGLALPTHDLQGGFFREISITVVAVVLVLSKGKKTPLVSFLQHETHSGK
jgi:hypothetical protein